MSVVIFCKEQILNRVENSARPVLGWPTGAIRIGQATALGVYQPGEAGVWSTMEDEVSWLNEAAGGTIKEESPGTASNAAPPADAATASASYSGNVAPPEPPVATVPSVDRS